MGEHSSTGRLPTTSPISLVSERSRGRVKMHCARCGLKEVSIVGRLFGERRAQVPKWPGNSKIAGVSFAHLAGMT